MDTSVAGSPGVDTSMAAKSLCVHSLFANDPALISLGRFRGFGCDVSLG